MRVAASAAGAGRAGIDESGIARGIRNPGVGTRRRNLDVRTVVVEARCAVIRHELDNL